MPVRSLPFIHHDMEVWSGGAGPYHVDPGESMHNLYAKCWQLVNLEANLNGVAGCGHLSF